MGWCKNHSNSHRINKDSVEIMREEVDNRSSFEETAGYTGGVRNAYFIKIGHISTWPRTTWKDYLEHPRRAHPPAELTSRDAMKDAFSSIIKIVKNSDSYADVINEYINKNMNADSSLKETHGNSNKRTYETSKNQGAEEVMTSSSSEDEAASSTLNNKDMIKSGTVPEATESLLTHIFSIPTDNIPTLERLLYEISKLLLKENSIIACDSPLAPGRMISCASLPHGKSKSTNVRRSNMLKKVIEIKLVVYFIFYLMKIFKKHIITCFPSFLVSCINRIAYALMIISVIPIPSIFLSIIFFLTSSSIIMSISIFK